MDQGYIELANVSVLSQVVKCDSDQPEKESK